MTRRPRARRPRRPTGARLRYWLALPALAALAMLALLQPVDHRAHEVVIPARAGVVAIGRILERAHAIAWAPAFVLLAEASGQASRLKAGEYVFAPGARLTAVLSAISHGEVVVYRVTVPEGATSRATAAILEAQTVLVGPAPVAPEGALLPETYEVRRGETRVHVTRRLRDARDALLARLWAGRAKGLPYLSPEQAVTMASIVEKETARPQERPRIAAVFVNRLERGMRLETDPAVIYGLTGGAPLGHGLRVSELAAPTPYNTYLVAGLPPTPIGNPGRASLEAALNPARTGDLYFVADGTGGHVFAATFEDHLRNVARWRAIEQARAAGVRP